MRTHRVAVVGCGAFARGWHLPNIVANPRTDLAVVCDMDPAVAEQCRRDFGARRACVDWRPLLDDPEIDLIVLATHTSLRNELIIPALRNGKPVCVEKPLAGSVPEMLDILRATGETKVPVCVGHNRRSCPAVLDLKRLLDKARATPAAVLPSIDRSDGGRRELLPEQRQVQILIRVNDDCRSWKDWIYFDDKGILFAEMVHFIDIALWLNPHPPVRVFAEGSARGNFSLVIRFQDGSTATIHHTLAGHFDYPKELYEVSANHVTLAVDHLVELRQRGLPDEPFRITYPFKDGNGRPCTDGIEGFHRAVTDAFEKAQQTGTAPAFITPDKGHAAQLDRFLDCIEGRGENPCDPAGAVVVTRVALKLLESIRLGIPVPLGPEDWHLPTGDRVAR